MIAATLPDEASLLAAMEGTWPAAEVRDEAGWRLRRGDGGGQRVSAATRLDAGARVKDAEAAMRAWGQRPLFQLTAGHQDLDDDLAARGYEVVDPVFLYAAPTERLLVEGSEVAKILRGDRRIALVEEIWATGGVGPGRFAVMDRVEGAKSFVLARLGDRPAGVAFVAVDDTPTGRIGMVHAIEVMPHQRRKGAGRLLMAGAARYAHEAGAAYFGLAVTQANNGANALYRALGMEVAGRYHYRRFQQE